MYALYYKVHQMQMQRMNDFTSSNLRYWGVKDSGVVVIPEGVKIIDSYVFGEDVTSIKLPKTLESIRSDAFCSCKITSIKLPESH